MQVESIVSQYKVTLRDFYLRQVLGFKQVFSKPVALVLTILVLAVSLMLPTWLYLVKKNSTSPIAQIRQSAQISLFLKSQVSDERALELVKILRAMPDILAVEHASKEKTYEIFKAESGLGEQIEALGENPLPATLFIEVSDISSVEKIQQTMEHLAKLPETDLVTMDLYWANKLQALLDVVNRLFWGLVMMFGLAFMLVVFFAIKTVVQEHLEEIGLTLILGATHRYIKAKFVQMGFWLGLLASLLCVIITKLAVLWVSTPLSIFAAEFAVTPEVQMLSFFETIILLLLGTTFAVTTAWMTCTQFLLKIEKQIGS